MQSKADSFSAFLEAKQKSRPSAPTTSAGTSFSLLSALAGAPQNTLGLTELMTASGMGFTEFADALKSLKDSGYLALSGPPNAEMATLTPLGESVFRSLSLK
jgi:predicted transcriptional regulator